jgi:hypothetical protein
MRRGRRHFAKSGAGTCTDSCANTNPDAISDPDADSNADSDSNTNAEWRNDVHDHLGRGITEDVDRPTGNARDIREQRHTRARDGLRSTSGPYGLS